MNISHESLTIDQAFDQAISHHQVGRLQDAEQLYRAILQAQPNHPDANHNLGVLALQVNQPVSAVAHLKIAAMSNPNHKLYWLNYIDALIQAQQLETAREMLGLAKRQGMHGDEVDALAVRLDSAGDESLKVTQQDTSPTPQQVNALIALFNEGRYSETVNLAQSMTAGFPSYGFGWVVLGAALKQMGRSADALEPMQKAVALSPDDVDAHNNLGVTLQQLGRLDEAEACCRRALQIKPDYAVGHNNLGNILDEQGRIDDAEMYYRQALKLMPEYAKAHNNLGNVLKKQGRLNEAEAAFRLALDFKSDYAEVYNNLGGILQALGAEQEAEAAYRKAIQITPNFAEAYYNLGNSLQKSGRLIEAESYYRQAIQHMPNLIEAHYNLGNIRHELGQLNEAEASFRQTVELKPDYAEAHSNLADILKESDRLDEAESSYRRALQLKSDYAEALNNLAITLMALDRFNESEICLRRALQINPDYTQAINNLGSLLQKCGQLEDAVVLFRRALEIKPDYAEAHSNLIFALDLMPGENSAALQEERKRWDAIHATHLHQRMPHDNIPEPERRLRIGYVSADFRGHSAARAFGSILTHYDRSKFDVFAYSNFKGKGDKYTEQFKQNVTAWRDIGYLSDDAVAKMIRDDQIDILVDLSGHSAGNRLPVFARKPAPVQITAWGYATGTGMQTIDVFFNDPVMLPPDEKHYFSEEVRYLPSMVGAYFTDPFPEVNELPALSSGTLTFSSFNRLTKLSDIAFRAWAEILRAVPQSRLILKAAELKEPTAHERIIKHFLDLGVAADRIIMQGKTPWNEHMQAHHQIDIALDAFPHCGGVTVLEGLMMGVPVITLRWPTVSGRGSASIMTTVGLQDWIAESPEEYIDLAIRKAKDLQALAALRKQLRGMFTSSIIGDHKAYAQAVEQEYRQLWREWCEK